MYTYKMKQTCAVSVRFDVREGRLRDVRFERGCAGNASGVGKLVEGMEVDEVIARLQGIPCGRKATSCPDQLAAALVEWKRAQKNEGD